MPIRLEPASESVWDLANPSRSDGSEHIVQTPPGSRTDFPDLVRIVLVLRKLNFPPPPVVRPTVAAPQVPKPAGLELHRAPKPAGPPLSRSPGATEPPLVPLKLHLRFGSVAPSDLLRSGPAGFSALFRSSPAGFSTCFAATVVLPSYGCGKFSFLRTGQSARDLANPSEIQAPSGQCAQNPII